MDYWWDKDDKYKEMADNLFINGILNEKEYTSAINKKEKNRDDFSVNMWKFVKICKIYDIIVIKYEEI